MLASWLRKVAVCGASFAALIMASAYAGPTQTISTSVSLDQDVVLEGQPCELMVLFGLDLSDFQAGQQRPPVNVALVIDRSLSMKFGGRMDAAKQMARDIMGALGKRDRISVVEYDDRATIVWGNSEATADTLVFREIDRLEPRGGTNLVDGMMAGVGQLVEHYQEGALNRVVLLSDGHANRGTTEAKEIVALARYAKMDGVSITTIGLGDDFNEDVLMGVARRSGGAYHYAATADELRADVRQELIGMDALAARQVGVAFAPSEAVQSAAVLGHAGQDETVTVGLDDLPAGAQRNMVLRLSLNALPAGEHQLGHINLDYVDAQTGEPVHLEAAVRVRVSSDPAEVAAGVNEDAQFTAQVSAARELHAKALRMLGQGQRDAALMLLRDLVAEAPQDELLRASLRTAEQAHLDKAALKSLKEELYRQGL